MSRRVLAATVFVTAVGCALAFGQGAVTAPQESGSGSAGSAAPLDPVRAAVAAGRDLRIDGPHGPIRVFIPAGYHADTGATIIYVHGYYDTVDTAWVNHRLAEQFALSAANALFIAPETPGHKHEPVNYPDLGELLRAVEDGAGVERGSAYTAVFGHSGAIRTMYEWLDEPIVDAFGFVDALYLDEPPIVAWAKASDHRKLIVIGEDTILESEDTADELPGTVRLDRFPPQWTLWPDEAKRAHSVYIRAQFTHMGLVTNAFVLPALVRLLPVELLPTAPWQQELGSLIPIDPPAKPAKKK